MTYFIIHFLHIKTLGIGSSALKPNQWWVYDPTATDALDSLRVGLMISINTPYFIGSILAIILNLIIPLELVDDEDLEVEALWEDETVDGDLGVTKDKETPPLEPEKEPIKEDIPGEIKI